jgi:hypothetical protein
LGVFPNEILFGDTSTSLWVLGMIVFGLVLRSLGIGFLVDFEFFLVKHFVYLFFLCRFEASLSPQQSIAS